MSLHLIPVLNPYITFEKNANEAIIPNDDYFINKGCEEVNSQVSGSPREIFKKIIGDQRSLDYVKKWNVREIKPINFSLLFSSDGRMS